MTKQQTFAYLKKRSTDGSYCGGLVFLGCGGKISDWIEGLKKDVFDKEFLGLYQYLEDPYTLKTTGGRTDIVYHFKDCDEINQAISRIAIWRIQFGDCSWISDYITNYAKHHDEDIIVESDEDYDEGNIVKINVQKDNAKHHNLNDENEDIIIQNDVQMQKNTICKMCRRHNVEVKTCDKCKVEGICKFCIKHICDRHNPKKRNRLCSIILYTNRSIEKRRICNGVKYKKGYCSYHYNKKCIFTK